MIPETDCIILEGLGKSFPKQPDPALHPLDLVIRPGTVTGLVGPDGAGKTTLLRILAGLLRPDRGNCKVAGLDPLRQSKELRAILGYMPQRFGLYEDLSVRENLDLYAALRGITDKKKDEAFLRLLRFTRLGPFQKRLAGKLSGGMKQKLGLACALLGEPRVLLLDEPGVGVDPLSRRELWAMVHELTRLGMLIVWSTSYLDEAEQCRDVLLLHQGRLLYSGPPEALTQSIAERSFLVREASFTNPGTNPGTNPDEKPEGKRSFLRRAMRGKAFSDGSIQGNAVRLILKREITPEAAAMDLGLPEDALQKCPARFEDAFIDLLGGAPEQEPDLDELMERKAGSASEIVIEALDLSKKFGGFTAADHINFAVRRGEIFGLLGPNGAGKSTTFKMMCGLLKPSSGKARVMGLDLGGNAARARQKLGYMAQKFSLYGGLSLRQNLEFFSGVYGLSGREQARRIADMITTFNFTEILDRSAEELPLGFKQRLALACALMHRPDILFLDEPTSGVDPLTRREFWGQINSMVEKGVTVMVTTHFMDEAEYCDRIGLVYRGRLIAAGTPDELKSRAENEPDARSAQIDMPMTMPMTMEDAFIALIEKYDLQLNAGN